MYYPWLNVTITERKVVDESPTSEPTPPSPEGEYASDPIPDWEADWIERELESGDMTVDEFLRRSA